MIMVLGGWVLAIAMKKTAMGGDVWSKYLDTS
jgi:hypothetical protein